MEEATKKVKSKNSPYLLSLICTSMVGKTFRVIFFSKLKTETINKRTYVIHARKLRS